MSKPEDKNSQYDQIRYEEKDGRWSLILDLEITKEPTEEEKAKLYAGFFKQVRKLVPEKFRLWRIP